MAAPLLGNAGRDLTNVLLFFLARRPTTGLRTHATRSSTSKTFSVQFTTRLYY